MTKRLSSDKSNIVRYDGHMCNHELLHRLRSQNDDVTYEEEFTKALKNTDTIITDVNMYTLPGLANHFKDLRTDYPNIKNILLTASSCQNFDSVCYSDVFERFNHEHITHMDDEYHNIVKLFSYDAFKKSESMPLSHLIDNVDFLRSLYWVDELNNYTSVNFEITDSIYMHWYLSIKQYWPVTFSDWDEIIKSNKIEKWFSNIVINEDEK